MTSTPQRGLRSVFDVAERHLCTGCGACAYAEPAAVQMVDDISAGRRPVPVHGGAGRRALEVCPGIGLSHEADPRQGPGIPELAEVWGPVLEVWEGYAGDSEIRYAGSSGGVATALALHCLEREEMHGVVHIAARPDVPYLNHTVMSRTREDLMEATGSRYAPASPCDRLQDVSDAPRPCVFIGKPCDVAATAKARRLDPALDRNLGLTVAVFCAGTPTTAGTLEMLRAMGMEDPEEVRTIRYRGNGWPGDATVTTVGGDHMSLTYEDSWGRILQRHRQWRCHVCADHTGEFADVAVGDPWYRPIEADPGRSLVLVRTERGRRLVREAIATGALVLEPAASRLVPASQPNLLRTRGAVIARVMTTNLLGVPSPRFENLPMASSWWRELSRREKAQSVYGTAKRVVTRRLWRRRPVVPYVPKAAHDA